MKNISAQGSSPVQFGRSSPSSERSSPTAGRVSPSSERSSPSSERGSPATGDNSPLRSRRGSPPAGRVSPTTGRKTPPQSTPLTSSFLQDYIPEAIQTTAQAGWDQVRTKGTSTWTWLRPYMSADYLKKTTMASIERTIVPWLNPVGYADKTKASKNICGIVQGIKIKLTADIVYQENLIKKLEKSQSTEKQIIKAKDELAELRTQLEGACKSYETHKTHLNHLQQLNTVQKMAQFTTVIAQTANLVVPGSGPLVGVAMKVVSIGSQQGLTGDFTNKCAEDTDAAARLAAKERRAMNNRTLITIASTIASTVAPLALHYMLQSVSAQENN
ncbi:MAG: hypothetical protein WCF65_06220 [Parachlamydiaceae bacterium]